MKLKFLLLIMVTSVSCTKGSVVSKLLPRDDANFVNAKQISAAQKICQNNDGIKSFEVRINSKDSAYFFCNKQGFLEVTSAGEVQTVKVKDQNFLEISSAFLTTCMKTCGQSSIFSLSPSLCTCEDGRTLDNSEVSK